MKRKKERTGKRKRNCRSGGYPKEGAAEIKKIKALKDKNSRDKISWKEKYERKIKRTEIEKNE
jgi:hypothetical protein